jgi:hypothetical protein
MARRLYRVGPMVAAVIVSRGRGNQTSLVTLSTEVGTSTRPVQEEAVTVSTRFAALVVLALVATACGGNKNKYIRRQAAQDLTCSEGQVHLSTINKGNAQYLAQACGRRAVYTYSRETGAVRISEIEGAVGAVTGGQPVVMPPPGGNTDAPPPPPPPPAP